MSQSLASLLATLDALSAKPDTDNQLQQPLEARLEAQHQATKSNQELGYAGQDLSNIPFHMQPSLIEQVRNEYFLQQQQQQQQLQQLQQIQQSLLQQQPTHHVAQDPYVQYQRVNQKIHPATHSERQLEIVQPFSGPSPRTKITTPLTHIDTSPSNSSVWSSLSHPARPAFESSTMPTRISPQVLADIARICEVGAIFGPLRELQYAQQKSKEMKLLNEREGVLEKHNRKRMELEAQIIIRKITSDALAKEEARMEHELRLFDKRVIELLDSELYAQQASLERLGVPLFMVTDDKDKQLQQRKVLELILEMSDARTE
ncbi:hypothetical protein BJ742DRAFT_410295 [Cladochytrium replicatum]|nr:hypothetical protein BJ742DRAFT_410295 [Cladochytrium replicatum]